MLGRKTRRVATVWGGGAEEARAGVGSNTTRAMDDADAPPGVAWWNVWVLLSESVGSTPLLLLEPSSWNLTQLQRGKGAYVWPPRDAWPLGQGPALRFRTPLDMQQGDMLLFRSSAVAHGAGKLL